MTKITPWRPVASLELDQGGSSHLRERFWGSHPLSGVSHRPKQQHSVTGRNQSDTKSVCCLNKPEPASSSLRERFWGSPPPSGVSHGQDVDCQGPTEQHHSVTGRNQRLDQGSLSTARERSWGSPPPSGVSCWCDVDSHGPQNNITLSLVATKVTTRMLFASPGLDQGSLSTVRERFWGSPPSSGVSHWCDVDTQGLHEQHHSVTGRNQSDNTSACCFTRTGQAPSSHERVILGLSPTIRRLLLDLTKAAFPPQESDSGSLPQSGVSCWCDVDSHGPQNNITLSLVATKVTTRVLFASPGLDQGSHPTARERFWGSPPPSGVSHWCDVDTQGLHEQHHSVTGRNQRLDQGSLPTARERFWGSPPPSGVSCWCDVDSHGPQNNITLSLVATKVTTRVPVASPEQDKPLPVMRK
ncbi:hypothetical protein B0O80DRAFT_519308 [Mortierella sp. GBAus27b]|nr:hypothetical protein B0O80DRAFT_519308 [Mortierella sp. GBAus27b]